MVVPSNGLNLSGSSTRDLVLVAGGTVLAHPISGIVIVAFVVAGFFGVLLIARIWAVLRNFVQKHRGPGNTSAPNTSTTPATITSLFTWIFHGGSTPQSGPPTHTTNNAHTDATAAVGEEARSNATLPLYTPYPTETMRQHNHDPFFIRIFSLRSSPLHWSSMQQQAPAATDVQIFYVTQAGYAIPAEPPPAYTPQGRTTRIRLAVDSWRARFWNNQ
ncbi:hypothetical protein CPB86DRAFT_783589 [Serendipita vermifera]|nr:hypothetical protein CPB86DRAFT_783589 [Serendipita vermifera]